MKKIHNSIALVIGGSGVVQQSLAWIDPDPRPRSQKTPIAVSSEGIMAHTAQIFSIIHTLSIKLLLLANIQNRGTIL